MYVYTCNKVHLATELSSGAPGVSVAHAPPPNPHLLPPAAFAATVLLSCDTPVHLNGTLNFLSVSAVTLSGLTNSGCGDRMTKHGIHLSRCSISKEINFCDQCLIVSLCRYIMNWQICNPVNQRRGRWCNWHKLDLWFQLLIALPLSLCFLMLIEGDSLASS